MPVYFKIKLRIAAITLIISVHGLVFGQARVHLVSPDKKTVFAFEIRSGKPGYSVQYEGKSLIDFSVLSLRFNNEGLANAVRLEKSVTLDSSERYTMMTGRSGAVNDSFRQVSLHLREIKENGRSYILEVRAFNDGVALSRLDICFYNRARIHFVLQKRKMNFK